MVSDDVKLRHFYWPQSPVEKSTYGPVMANNKKGAIYHGALNQNHIWLIEK